MKPFNILTDSLPDAVTLFGVEYPVRTDARTWLAIAGMMESGEENVGKMLRLCYKEKLPDTMESAYLGMLSFLNRGTEFLLPRDGETQSEQLVSFLQDADAIFASFYERYHIDLTKDMLHWYVFCSLFSALSVSNPLGELVKIRTADVHQLKDPNMRRKLQALKTRHCIRGKKREVDVAKQMAEVF